MYEIHEERYKDGENKMIMFSEVTGKSYEAEDVCMYVNPKQAAWMMSKGCELVDVYPSNEKLILSFWKKDHRRLFPEWMERKVND